MLWTCFASLAADAWSHLMSGGSVAPTPPTASAPPPGRRSGPWPAQKTLASITSAGALLCSRAARAAASHGGARTDADARLAFEARGVGRCVPSSPMQVIVVVDWVEYRSGGTARKMPRKGSCGSPGQWAGSLHVHTWEGQWMGGCRVSLSLGSQLKISCCAGCGAPSAGMHRAIVVAIAVRCFGLALVMEPAERLRRVASCAAAHTSASG